MQALLIIVSLALLLVLAVTNDTPAQGTEMTRDQEFNANCIKYVFSGCPLIR